MKTCLPLRLSTTVQFVDQQDVTCYLDHVFFLRECRKKFRLIGNSIGEVYYQREYSLVIHNPTASPSTPSSNDAHAQPTRYRPPYSPDRIRDSSLRRTETVSNGELRWKSLISVEWFISIYFLLSTLSFTMVMACQSKLVRGPRLSECMMTKYRCTK